MSNHKSRNARCNVDGFLPSQDHEHASYHVWCADCLASDIGESFPVLEVLPSPSWLVDDGAISDAWHIASEEVENVWALELYELDVRDAGMHGIAWNDTHAEVRSYDVVSVWPTCSDSETVEARQVTKLTHCGRESWHDLATGAPMQDPRDPASVARAQARKRAGMAPMDTATPWERQARERKALEVKETQVAARNAGAARRVLGSRLVRTADTGKDVSLGGNWRGACHRTLDRGLVVIAWSSAGRVELEHCEALKPRELVDAVLGRTALVGA